jgi:hypothetical protein
MGLSTFVVQFHIDVNLGDPLWPTPEEVDVPRLLGGASIRIRGHRVELILAEKIVTAIQRGTANTRWRDFVDIAALAHLDVNDGALVESIRRVAEFRQVPIRPLRTSSLASRRSVNSAGLVGVASRDSLPRRRPSSGTSSRA